MISGPVLAAEVVGIEKLAPSVKLFTLAARRGTPPLPPFSAGSHIAVLIPGGVGTFVNPYSLVNPPRPDGQYQIVVQRRVDSRGGSAFMHEKVNVGTVLTVSYPVNLFPLVKTGHKHVLIAGGIGITPFLAYLSELHDLRVPYEIHHTFREPEYRYLLDRYYRLCDIGSIVLYNTSERSRMDVRKILSSQPLGTHVYACGSTGIVSSVKQVAVDMGWPLTHVHLEQFTTPAGGAPFTACLSRSNLEVLVAEDQSLLEAIEGTGMKVSCLCRGGVCGHCETEVLTSETEILHRDHFLPDADKAQGKKIMLCVSRAAGGRLVLNL